MAKFDVGDAKLAALELRILENEGAAEPVGVGSGEGCTELVVPTDKE